MRNVPDKGVILKSYTLRTAEIRHLLITVTHISFTNNTTVLPRIGKLILNHIFTGVLKKEGVDGLKQIKYIILKTELEQGVTVKLVRC